MTQISLRNHVSIHFFGEFFHNAMRVTLFKYSQKWTTVYDHAGYHELKRHHAQDIEQSA
jgi:hypothetical protein